MKKSLLLLLGLCAAAVATAQSDNKAGTRFYVQPSVVLAVPGEFDVTAAPALAAGVNFLGNHSIEAEVVVIETEEKGGWYKLDMVPVLFSYKYRVPLTSQFSLYGGGSVGATTQRLRSAYGSGETKAAATFGFTGGLRYAFNDHLALDAGAKILRLEETSYTTEGNIELFHLGLMVQF